MLQLTKNIDCHTLSTCWGSVRKFFSFIEPHQPLFSTISILSKAAYKSSLELNKPRSIKQTTSRIRIIHKIERERGIPINHNRALTYMLNKEEINQLHTRIALMQLLSLSFPHPGSNPWNSSITILGRAASIHHYFRYKDRESTNLRNGALGIFSVLGTGVSLFKQLGLIAEYTPLCHAIIGLSFVSMTIETGLMLKNWLSR